MQMELSLNQTRVIACLMEKEITTPDQYPLSLNSLVTACNQKSNREPVMALTETDVQIVLDELREKRLIKEETGFGSRVQKYKHRFCNTEFGELQLNEKELAVLCTLFLRGPQTPGELRSRTNRLCAFSDVHEVERVLQQLSERTEGPFVVRLPREPGKRESRYAHLFSGAVEIVASQTPMPTASTAADDRVALLEQRVTDLEAELRAFKTLVDDLLS
ncbi:MAG: YceH family protein [Pontibacterium sp.]